MVSCLNALGISNSRKYILAKFTYFFSQNESKSGCFLYSGLVHILLLGLYPEYQKDQNYSYRPMTCETNKPDWVIRIHCFLGVFGYFYEQSHPPTCHEVGGDDFFRVAHPHEWEGSKRLGRGLWIPNSVYRISFSFWHHKNCYEVLLYCARLLSMAVRSVRTLFGSEEQAQRKAGSSFRQSV